MKVSVITINYNNASGLRKTIESVVNQTCKDYEYIIIDGGSTDGSIDVIKEYSDKITYWVSEKDNGIYNAMNKGIKVAKGDYCIFMNSGDYFFKNNVLDNVVPLLTGKDFYTGKSKLIQETTFPFLYTPPKYISVAFLMTNVLHHQATFIKTSVLKTRSYNESYKILSDWEEYFFEFIYNQRSYQSLPYIIVVFYMNGISATSPELSKYEAETILNGHLPPFIQKALIGNTKFERTIHAWNKDSLGYKLLEAIIVLIDKTGGIIRKNIMKIRRFFLKWQVYNK